ncbi:MAG: Eco29kI family restriction endonuclease [Candidatus Competibacteraceae bacterium]|nr:Eco29kI family restriction endonuclease [Candidatus Competibacteraceae bacterium]
MAPGRKPCGNWETPCRLAWPNCWRAISGNILSAHRDREDIAVQPDGFGNKDPGNRRATQYRSSWDVLHPGRAFAEKLAGGGTTPEEALRKLERYFAGLPISSVSIPNDEAEDEGDT